MRTQVLPLAHRASRLTGSVIDSSTSLLAAQTHDIVRFAMGSPADEAVPLDEFRDISAATLDHHSLTYGATEGEPELLHQLLAYLAASGQPTSRDRLTITSGGMQGLDLAFKLFVDPGDLVIVESPTYTNGSATAASYGARILEAPMDDNGLIVEALPSLVEKAGRIPKAIYVIPNFQNPTGTTLSLGRRERLIELAHEWNAVIVDDDPYELLRFSGEHLPGFQELSPDDPLIFSVRTFSKILAPGIRVGWVDTDPAVRELVIKAKQAMDTCTNVPAQHLVAEFIRRGGLANHIERIRATYHERKLAMVASLTDHLGERITMTDPDGGFFLWLTLQGADASTSTSDLFETALAEGVAFIPGPALSAAGHFDDALRLCFASSSPERIEEGVQRLTRALDIARDAR
ncbi:PLP-dependent aminotransferase family protein [Homoserinimonas sp. OAct 916]|uniref:aminotransferase-like domain-containing protein n=1 Tax=Homoserinimonas sp. OAct 916 TaxID=2211450 RepID=UPI000DBE192A|nr:PLP-dependent aminotransferase family protein [Homoserinimonas sp. OAct 916]